MEFTTGNYAQIADDSNIVENVILMSSDFKMDGYTFILIEDGVACQPGAFYNITDKKFYLDERFEIECGAVYLSKSVEHESS